MGPVRIKRLFFVQTYYFIRIQLLNRKQFQAVLLFINLSALIAMKNSNSVDDILLYAIKSEKETAEFYLRLSTRARNLKTKRIFEQYAREEFTHVVRLTKVRDRKPYENMEEQLSDFKLSNYVLDLKPDSNLSYSGELALAMRKVLATFRLYFDLASRANDNETQSVLQALAEDEAKHKLGFEIEYNESLLCC